MRVSSLAESLVHFVWQGDHLAGLRLQNCGSSKPSQPFQLMTDHTAAAEAAARAAAESPANHSASPNENTLGSRLPPPLSHTRPTLTLTDASQSSLIHDLPSEDFLINVLTIQL